MEKRSFIVYELDEIGCVIGLVYYAHSFDDLKAYIGSLELDAYLDRVS